MLRARSTSPRQGELNHEASRVMRPAFASSTVTAMLFRMGALRASAVALCKFFPEPSAANILVIDARERLLDVSTGRAVGAADRLRVQIVAARA